MQPLVSVIMPVYNAGPYIRESIDSLLNQTFTNWELVLVNDGSTDETEKILLSYTDPRIRIFSQENKGVSAARNTALGQMQGKYFTFLDADDLLPANSLELRVNFAENNPSVDMIAGGVRFFSHDHTLKTWFPKYKGDPFRLFIRNDERVFCNPALFIRRKPSVVYRFKEGMTHVEDLLFFTSLAQQQTHHYDYLNEIVYNYRVSGNSAMNNLEKLESGYWTFYEEVKSYPNVMLSEVLYLKRRIIRIMFLSYLAGGKWGKAARVLFKFFKSDAK
jgi:teichuronic acid biosynthesis glycosyltransferase TuaG